MTLVRPWRLDATCSTWREVGAENAVLGSPQEEQFSQRAAADAVGAVRRRHLNFEGNPRPSRTR
ncbi:hypothetical protein [Nostoc sp.]|uniref:hypothetical protein n=1 Tax=Nostoc sp. TaxID=1180 RepID=UPI002FF7BF4F